MDCDHDLGGEGEKTQMPVLVKSVGKVQYLALHYENFKGELTSLLGGKKMNFWLEFQ